jgi:trimeric autotransporter adhesin
MNRVVSRAIVVAGLVVALGGAASWGQVPSSNDKSDNADNTGSGTQALVNISTQPVCCVGHLNTAFGSQALFKNTEGAYNTAVGADALYANTSTANTAIGNAALSSNTTGHDNTAVGFAALFANTKTYPRL